jgi:gliding motility-associated-like protein
MILQTKRAILLLMIFYLPAQILFSQNHTSRNNYTGNWETPTSWTTTWTAPQTDIKNIDITIYGYITRNGSLIFSGGSSNLIVYDTLVIKGNFSIDHENGLLIKDNGILIIRGDLFIDDDADVTANGYLIVTGNILMNHHIPNGSFTSNDNPVKVFFGGSISSEIPKNSSLYPVFNCAAYIQYSHSGCSYGDMTDIKNDPIFPFFQSTFIIVTISATPGTICSGANVQLNAMASGGSGSYTYYWTSVPAGFTSSVANPIANPAVNAIYYVSVSDGIATVTLNTVVTVNTSPVTPVISASGPTTFCSGGSITLTSGAGTSYLWSNGATTQRINVTSSGSYTVRVKNANGCQSLASDAIAVIVNALPSASVITADGPVTFCSGGSVTLTSGAGTSYLWSNGATTQSIIIKTTGTFSIRVTNEDGCQSAPSSSLSVTVNEVPVAVAGSDQELEYVFNSLMSAELFYPEIGEWSLISGSGNIGDIHSPTTTITGLSVGENSFLWKVNNGYCEAAEDVKITVKDLFVPSVITPDGDGKNEYFRISAINGETSLIIFNKWGNEEYTNSNYLNDWDGHNNKGSEMPNDTYFYILKLKNGDVRKGSVLIKR